MNAERVPTINGADIRAERARRKVSQAELAAEVGWFASTLVNIENDQVEVTQDACRRLLDAIERIAERKRQEQAA